jgi:hypothetical protein
MKVSIHLKNYAFFGAIENGAHSDVVHAIYRGVLYFLNVVHVKT